MKKVVYIFAGVFLTVLSAQSQEIIPFPDLSEHYNFRNTGGESLDEKPYAHLDADYQKALEALDGQIAQIEQQIKKYEGDNTEPLQKELQKLQIRRTSLLKEAELQSDLFQLH